MSWPLPMYDPDRYDAETGRLKSSGGVESPLKKMRFDERVQTYCTKNTNQPLSRIFFDNIEQLKLQEALDMYRKSRDMHLSLSVNEFFPFHKSGLNPQPTCTAFALILLLFLDEEHLKRAGNAPHKRELLIQLFREILLSNTLCTQSECALKCYFEDVVDRRVLDWAQTKQPNLDGVLPFTATVLASKQCQDYDLDLVGEFLELLPLCDTDEFYCNLSPLIAAIAVDRYDLFVAWATRGTSRGINRALVLLLRKQRGIHECFVDMDDFENFLKRVQRKHAEMEARRLPVAEKLCLSSKLFVLELCDKTPTGNALHWLHTKFGVVFEDTEKLRMQEGPFIEHADGPSDARALTDLNYMRILLQHDESRMTWMDVLTSVRLPHLCLYVLGTSRCLCFSRSFFETRIFKFGGQTDEVLCATFRHLACQSSWKRENYEFPWIWFSQHIYLISYLLANFYVPLPRSLDDVGHRYAYVLNHQMRRDTYKKNSRIEDDLDFIWMYLSFGVAPVLICHTHKPTLPSTEIPFRCYLHVEYTAKLSWLRARAVIRALNYYALTFRRVLRNAAVATQFSVYFLPHPLSEKLDACEVDAALSWFNSGGGKARLKFVVGGGVDGVEDAKKELQAHLNKYLRDERKKPVAPKETQQ